MSAHTRTERRMPGPVRDSCEGASAGRGRSGSADPLEIGPLGHDLVGVVEDGVLIDVVD